MSKYIEKLKIDNSNCDDKHYHMRARCSNCGEDFWWIKVPKGVIVKKWEKDLKCSNCEIVGKIGVY